VKRTGMDTKDLRIVVLIQENKTTDFYFPTLALWGADVEHRGRLLATAPDHDQPHDRSAWVHYRLGDYPAVTSPIDNDSVIPYYSWLAKTFTFCDHHFGLGSNSTSGHMMLVGGQTPTLRNYFTTPRSWDLPTIFKHAERNGVPWAAFPDDSKYPTACFTELMDGPSIHPPDDFFTMAAQDKLPRLCYLWSPAGYDEHPPAQSNPGYVTAGEELTWRRVDAVVKSGHWEDTVFILTWDDWGGYADHVQTPISELVPDALHPSGFPAIGGSRIPLVMFGGQVAQGIESEWHSHASVPRTVIDLLGLPPFGVARVDGAPSLAGRVSASNRPQPPAPGAQITQPRPPSKPPATVTGKWSGAIDMEMPPLIANGGKQIPAPTDGTVYAKPPKVQALQVLNVAVAPNTIAGAAYLQAFGRPQLLAPGIAPNPADDLQFHGGKTMPALSFLIVFLGQAWPASDRHAVASARAAAMTDSGLNAILSQYFGGKTPTSTALASQLLDTTVAARFDQASVNDVINTLLSDGMLDGIDLPSSVVNLLLPPGAVLVDSSGPQNLQGLEPDATDSLHGLGGYHGSIHIGARTVYYAVGVYSQVLGDGTMNGIVAFDQPWKNVVATFYHELTEVRTDADVDDAIAAGNDPNAEHFLGWTSPQGAEIGDEPVFEAGNDLSLVFKEIKLAGGGGTAPVQLMWSNRVHGPEEPPQR
jgi:hypothetical protein